MNTVILTGPTQFSHLKWENKEFLLFGDEHIEYSIGQYDFVKFIKIIAEYTNMKQICVDFFLEKSFRKEINIDTKAPLHGDVFRKNLIQFLGVLFSGNNIYDTHNYNYFRIQNWELSQYLFDTPHKSLLTEIYEKVVLEAIKLSDNILVYNFFCNNEMGQHDENFKRLVQDINYTKEISKFEYEKFISNLIHKQLQNIDREYFCKEQLIDYFYSQLDANAKRRNFRNIIDVRLSVLETYTIARMFRNQFKIRASRYNKCNGNKPNNIIYFGGSDHTDNIINFLKYIAGDKLINIFESKKTGFNNEISFQIENYFNLFDSKEHIQRLLESSNLRASAKVFIPSTNVTKDEEYESKYLKYKHKYIKLKKLNANIL